MIDISVYKNKRGESSVQFLETAREIHIHSIRQAAKIPNKFKYFLSGDIVSLAASGHLNAKKGNSINPKNQHEVQIRRDYFMSSYADYQALISQVGVAIEFAEFTDSAITTWMRMIDDEMRLLKGVIDTDKSRYKDLP